MKVTADGGGEGLGGEGLIITATELKENLGKYLDYVREQTGPVIITKNGNRIARLTPYENRTDQYFIALDNNLDFQYDGKRVTYEEFMAIRLKSNLRMEFINGEIHLLATPSLGHQLLLGRIYEVFSASLMKNSYEKFCEAESFAGLQANRGPSKKLHCRAVLAPFEVHFYKRNFKEPDVIQPDLSVICDCEANIDDHGRYIGTPSLVIEIISASTRKKDLIDKLNTYMLSGVREYWIIDHKQQNILIYNFNDYMINAYNIFGSGSIAKSSAFDDLTVNVSLLFANLL